ncbi:SpoIID/LytB domain-containing protein [Oscillospiraceae bacterium LCP25S3_E10]|nr:SpoIID/LytB domain-containing protein [Ruminococcus sp.]MDY2856684.1 SpoIID/LytB domain-containing protein [Oscillospiraceae bacterium]
MKKGIVAVILTIITIAVVPLISIMGGGRSEKSSAAVLATESVTEKNTYTVPSDENTEKSSKPVSTTKAETSTTPPKSSAAAENTYKIYDKSTKKVITVNDVDFCCGALATETEADIPTEALKAQAVAIHTYYTHLRDESRKQNKEYDFQCNSKIWEVYADKNDIKAKWGDTFEESFGAIEKAVKEVSDILVLYNDSPAMTKYFEISSGTTDSYSEIYGKDIKYLTNVATPYDTVANNYQTKQTFSSEELNSLMGKKYKDYKAADADKNVSEIKKTNYSTVLSLRVGNKEIKGYEFADILKLRSSNFNVETKEGNYIFTVYGYGENIGLSKFGSCQLAKQGSSYIEILEYYYPGTKIVSGYKI